jgi:hypothetical protein
MTEELTVSDPHPSSGRTAIVADEGESVWLYLTGPDGSIAADCWLYNRVPAPSTAALRPRLGEYRARGAPPPAPAEVVGPSAHRDAPLDPVTVTLAWSADGEAVAASVDGVLVGFIAPGVRRGYSRHLRAAGPWGSPLDGALHAELFGRDATES